MRYASAVVVLAYASLASDALAQTYTFVKLADTGSVVPDHDGSSFVQFGAPAITPGTIVFRGIGEDGHSGIYLFSNDVIEKIADTNDDVPGGVGPFFSFSEPSVGGGKIAFTGVGVGEQGVYLHEADELSVVADTSTEIPDTQVPVEFVEFGRPSVNGGQVSFLGRGPLLREGIYQGNGGAVVTITNQSVAIPNGTGNFLSFGGVDRDGQNTVFIGHGSNGQTGVYNAITGTISRIADVQTNVPEGTGQFLSFLGAARTGDRIALQGIGSFGQTGAYTTDGGPLEVLAHFGTTQPDNDGFLTIVLAVSAFGDDTAFLALDEVLRAGIYVQSAEGLSKVIERGQTLDGRLVENLDIGPEAMSDGSVVFRATFDDGTEGVFAGVPNTPPGFETWSLNWPDEDTMWDFSMHESKATTQDDSCEWTLSTTVNLLPGLRFVSGPIDCDDDGDDSIGLAIMVGSTFQGVVFQFALPPVSFVTGERRP